MKTELFTESECLLFLPSQRAEKGKAHDIAAYLIFQTYIRALNALNKR